MDEKKKQWLKNIGIAGFLFFLFKGILWLIFGTAIYKWFKGLLVISAATMIPFYLKAQSIPNSLNEIKQYNFNAKQEMKPNLCIEEYKVKPFFCKLEDQLNENKKTLFKFRLGSLEYTNGLEYSQFLFKKEVEMNSSR